MEEDWITTRIAFESPGSWRRYLEDNSYTLDRLGSELKRKNRYLWGRERSAEDCRFVESFAEVVRQTLIMSVDTEGKLNPFGRVECTFKNAKAHGKERNCSPQAHLVLGNAAMGSLLIRLDHPGAVPATIVELFGGHVRLIGVSVSSDVEMLRRMGYSIPFNALCVELEPFVEQLYYREGHASVAFKPWWRPLGYRPEFRQNLGFFAFVASGRCHKPPKQKKTKQGYAPSPLEWYLACFGPPPEPIPSGQDLFKLYIWHGTMTEDQRRYTVIDAITPFVVLGLVLKPAAGKYQLSDAMLALAMSGVRGWESVLAEMSRPESIASRVVRRKRSTSNKRFRVYSAEKKQSRNRDRKRRRRLAKMFKRQGAEESSELAACCESQPGPSS